MTTTNVLEYIEYCNDKKDLVIIMEAIVNQNKRLNEREKLINSLF